MKLTKTNYVKEAENAILSMGYRDKRGGMRIDITTSKIRNLLSMISEIYNDVVHYKNAVLDDDFLSRIQYLKMHIAYEAGRERAVKAFVEKSELFRAIDEIGASKEQLIIFCHYMESLVAYRKYHFENDC